MMKCSGKPALLISLIVCLLSACSGGYRAPVSDAGNGPLFWDTGRVHRVNQGETLYIISLIYDLDYRLIAQVNDLREPYTIYTGQELLIDVRGVTLEPDRPQAGTQTAVRTNPVRTSPAITPVPTAPSTSSSSGQPVSRERENTSQPEPPPRTQNTEVSSWVWPAQGELIGRYSSGDNENKGIDIAGQRGDDVLASAAGQVVYAGGAILGYGELLIIKHNERFLTAYAHNERLVVSEGDQVTQGQKIAEMGSTGTDRVMLHFEVRLSGKPVDPLSYLP